METIWIVSICALCLASLHALYVYAWSIPTLQLFGPAIVRGPADANRIALTFDDGPSLSYTEQILDILCRRGVKATFFVCGQNVERHPEILRRIQAEAQTIVNEALKEAS